ncbi:MAG: tRNA (adenosine(37)-N6)-dimethylallyltransferase MiaA [Rikenellaceae bacterium]|nr:tRNA (adenosine(37)-N6)-dimethylallyltransferase MiaA [Rikenellaceae bacterium]
MSTKPTLIVVVGPTGSGKTALAIKLAQHYGAEILSTDSRQIFKGMTIGTAQPTADERAAAPHHFVDELSPEEEFTCGRFERQALELLDELFSRGDYVVAVGGSGLYVDALCNGMDDMPLRDDAIRNELTKRLNDKGLENLLQQLQQLDPEYYEQVDRCNPMRVLRALEVCLSTGSTYTELRKGTHVVRPFRIIKVGTDMPREVLYDRINRRVDLMLEAGLEQEARALYPLRHLNSLQTVGYRELFEYFDGNCTRDEAVELIKRNSRRYAKRQLTWFRRDESTGWFSPDDLDSIINFIDTKKAE